MRVFRDVEMVEALGSGMQRISKAYNLRSIIIFTDNFIKTVVPFYTQYGIEESDVQVNVQDNKSKLTERQLSIIAIIQSVAVNTKYISEQLGVNRKTAQRDLNKLSQMGIVQWVGSDKTGHWELCAEQ